MIYTFAIADAEQDPKVTEEVLGVLSRLKDPTSIPVFSTFEEQPTPIGHGVRFWRIGLTLWADLEVVDGAARPPPDEPLHAESIIAFRADGPNLVGIVLTSMPLGTLSGLISNAFQQFRPS